MITTAWFIGDKELNDVHMIRRAVFIDEQQINESDEMDGTDAACMHLVAYDDEGKPAATGRIMITNDELILGRIAVLPKYRVHQYGTLIVNVLIRACYEMGGDRQIVHAQLSARAFYEKLGFIAYGDIYDDAGIPHISMAHQGDSGLLCGRCQGA